MSSLFRTQQSFLQNNAWQGQALNALHYNVAQQGSVIPLIYGTTRQSVNVIDFDNYRGPQGKKGKTGSLPISGTSQTGKGGGGGKGKGDKKDHNFSIFIDFAICQGPVPPNPGGQIFTSAGVESFGAGGLNFYSGADGQAPDAHFNRIGYSGTCHMTGTPLVLGQSPVVPNIGLEVTGLLVGVHTGGYPKDANPGDIILDFLTNLRYGAGFPSECISQIAHDDTGTITDTYGDYCQAASLMVSTSLDGHQKAIEWLNGLVILTNSALVWSGRLLKVVPYGDLQLINNGMTWTPNFTPRYNLTDKDLLSWHPHQDGAVPAPGDDDPIILTRSNPADADNWVSIEYTDRLNFYNSTILTAFDQGAIDTYGLRIGDSLPGRAFTNSTSAQVALQLILQRRLYIRNTGIKFSLGWQFALLEPMDFVSLTGRLGDNYLNQYPVRITSIEENDNGDLTIIAEDPQAGVSAPVSYPHVIGAPQSGNADFAPRGGYQLIWLWGTDLTGVAPEPVYDWMSNHPPDSPKGTFSFWLNIDADHAPRPPGYPGGFASGDYYGFITLTRAFGTPGGGGSGGPGADFQPWPHELTIYMDYQNILYVFLGGHSNYLAGGDITTATGRGLVFQSHPGLISNNGTWQHLLITWNLPASVRVWSNGSEVDNAIVVSLLPDMVRYSTQNNFNMLSLVSTGGLMDWWLLGCYQDFWWDAAESVGDPAKFRNLNGLPKDLGFRGENVLGRPPNVFLHLPDGKNPQGSGSSGPVAIGSGWFGLNRAGYKCDDPVYWTTQNSSPYANRYCDPDHPNLSGNGDPPELCVTGFLPYA